MANVEYPKAKEHRLKGDMNPNTGSVFACAVDTGVYTYSATHEYLSSISAVGSPAVDARVGTDVELTGKTFTNGVFDASDITFVAISGSTVEAIVIYVAMGSPATYYVWLYIDTAGGLPFTPSGGDETVNWDNGQNKIVAT